jgi:hypothetical protein
MAVTQAEIDALRLAAARGVIEVRSANGETVKYASLEEMMRVAAELEGRIASATFQRTTFSGFARD